MFVFDINTATLTQVADAQEGHSYAERVEGYLIPEAIEELTSFQLVQLHNLLVTFDPVVNALKSRGRDVPAQTKKFADRTTGVKRVSRLAELVPALPTSEVSPEPVSEPTPEEAKRPRRLEDRRVEPKGRVIDPRPGSIQAKALDVLGTEDGMELHAFCEYMAQFKKGPKEWQPSNAFGGLKYLFCDQKGWGLERKDGSCVCSASNSFLSRSRPMTIADDLNAARASLRPRCATGSPVGSMTSACGRLFASAAVIRKGGRK
jgi:hypothetical protein